MPAAAAPSALSTLPVVVPATLDVPAVPEILEEHLEELGYLWLQRRKQIFSTDVPLRRLPELDGRIAAHWEGLVLGGKTAAELALGRLDDNHPWIAAAAVRVWIELGSPEPAAVLEKLAEAPEPTWGTWREAFRRLPMACLAALAASQDLAKQPMPLRLLLVDAYAWNGELPAQVALQEARQGPPAIKAVIARHLGSLPKDPVWSALATELLANQPPAVSRAALWSLGLLDRKRALAALRAHMAGSPTALDPAWLLLCGIFGERQDAAALLSVKGEVAAMAAAARAVGELGGLDCVDPLLERISSGVPEVALSAAAALERMLGPLASLEPSVEDEAAASPPLPDPVALASDINERKRKLSGTESHLDGRPYPWIDAPRDEPLAWLWRANVRGERADLQWIRREVPDGVLMGEWATDARVGE